MKKLALNLLFLLPVITFAQGEVLETKTETLTKNAYQEISLETDNIIYLGEALFNTTTGKIITPKQESILVADQNLKSRFFAVDPLAASFPWNSPYAFAENKAITFIELEGLESFYAADLTYLGSIDGKSKHLNVVVPKDIQNQVKNILTRLSGYKYDEAVHESHSEELQKQGIVYERNKTNEGVNSFLDNIKPKTSISTNIHSKKTFGFDRLEVDAVEELRKVANDYESTGDIIETIGIVISPFDGGATLTVGGIISNTGNVINITINISEGDIADAVIKGVSSFAPGVISKPLRKVVSKHFNKQVRKALKNGDKVEGRIHLQGKKIVDSKINILDKGTGAIIENTLNSENDK